VPVIYIAPIPAKGTPVPDTIPSVTEDADTVSRWWSSIGQRIASAWDAVDRQAAAFPELAAVVLADSPAPIPDLAAASLTWLAGAELPVQHNMGTGFGQPAVTVYRDDDFIVYLLLWFQETVTIHDHRFAGAFTILEGQSLQNVYQYEPGEQLWPGLEAGALRCTKVEALSPGEVRLIPPGTGLIHSNIHFAYPAPTVSLVARTLVQGQAPQQRLYSHAGMAFVDQAPSPDTVKRLQGLGAACRISPQRGVEYLRRAMADAHPRDVLSYVGAATGYFGSSLYLGPLVASSPLGRSDKACGLALQYAHQLYASLVANDQLAAFTNQNDRLLMSMIAAGTDWQMATDAIGQVRPGAPTRRALGQLAYELAHRARASGQPGACRVSDDALGYLALTGAGDAGGQPLAPPGPVYTELVTHRLFGPLFSFVLAGLDAPA
jgi:hypothetical protein